MVTMIARTALVRARRVAAGAGGASQTTWNSADKNASITLSASDRTATCAAGGSPQGVRSVGFKSDASGKFYFEAVVNFAASGDCWVGIAQSGQSLSAYVGSENDALISYMAFPNQTEGIASSASSYSSASISSGQTLMVAIDFDNSRAYFGAQGSWWDGADPAGNAGGLNISGRAVGNYYIFGGGSAAADSVNLPAAQTYTPPSGFSVWT